jgi:hypothetical protein
MFVRKPTIVAFFLAVAAIANFAAITSLLGVSNRAPDVVYGDEMDCPEGIVLALVAVEFYRGNRRASSYAAVIVLLNMIAAVFEPITLIRPFALLWTGIWMFFLIVVRSQALEASTDSSKIRLLGRA